MIKISKPTVIVLHETGLGHAEIAARTCYDSFDNSENESIKVFNRIVNECKELPNETVLKDIHDIEESDLLDKLAWVHHHHSILEHISLTYYIKGTSRGVLQEHARHRIQSLSVRSTRYTMNEVLYAFIASLKEVESKRWFIFKIIELDLFVQNGDYRMILANQLWDRLNWHFCDKDSQTFYEKALTPENQEKLSITNAEELFKALIEGKKKRNVGDYFKDIVDDNWKVDLVCTFNLRSLKNYFTLRNSGAAYYQIKMLAEAMIEATPKKYLKLILKEYK